MLQIAELQCSSPPHSKKQKRNPGACFGIWGTNLMRQNIEINNNTIVRNGSKDHWSAPTGGIDLRSPNFENVVVKDNISVDNYGFDLALPFEPSIENLRKTNLTLENNWVGKTTLVNETSDYGPLFPVESTLVSHSIFKDFNQNNFRVVLDTLTLQLDFWGSAGLILESPSSIQQANRISAVRKIILSCFIS